jgi:hypothetical protein
MDTRVKGELTELKCQLYCLEQGYVISKPILDNARYDMIIDYNGKFYRIQVKTSRWMSEEHEGIVFNCKSQHSVSGGNKIMKYSPEEIDFFMTEFENEYYLIPCDKARSEMKLRFKPTKNNQDNRAFFAKDYKFEEVIKQY